MAGSGMVRTGATQDGTNLLDRLRATGGPSLDDIMGGLEAPIEAPSVPDSRLVVEDFRPIAEGLEAGLARIYWQTAGIQAFAGNEVPFVINNHGRLSECAAQVVFGNCLECDPQGPIRVLELGAGSGLFALFFLDAFAAACRRQKRDFYDRLTYYVSDMSARTVADWAGFDQFARHAGRVEIGACDAMSPGQFQRQDGSVVELDGLRVVFANYLLDVLPAAVVRQVDGRVEQLCVRTLLDGEEDLTARDGGMDASTLRRLAASPMAEDRSRLLAVLPLLSFETQFRPLDRDLPHLDVALAFGAERPRTLLNHGAFDCIAACLDRLAPGGFVLASDYGPVDAEEAARFGTATRFGSSIAMGLNFPLLEAFLAARGKIVAAPDGDRGQPVHTRLVANDPIEFTCGVLADRYGFKTWELLDAPIEMARRHAAVDEVAPAVTAFRHAIRLNPLNWSFIGEAAEFMAANRLPGATRAARAALDLNPWYSAWLWNVLGDALFVEDDAKGALEAYRQALRINPRDTAAHYNLSFVAAVEGRYEDALAAAALALANDMQGVYRDRILQHQQRIIVELSHRWASEQQRLLRRAVAFE